MNQIKMRKFMSELRKEKSKKRKSETSIGNSKCE